jgi:hypothetical protein
MQRDFMREARPRKLFDFQYVAKEFGKVPNVGAHVPALGSVFCRGELVPDVVHAASGRCDDVVVIGEVADEELLGGLGLYVRAAVGHRLAAACLVERVVNLHAEFLQQLQRCHTDLGIEHVDIARNHQSDAHSR